MRRIQAGNNYSAVDAAEPIDWDNPLAKGMLAWWMAPPGVSGNGGRLLDLVGKNHGTLTGFTATGSQGWTGRHGFGAIQYASASSNRTIVNSSDGILKAAALSGSQWTIAAFINTTATNPGSGRAIYCERDTTGVGNDILKLDSMNANECFVTLRDDAGTLLQTSNTTVINDGKDHVVMATLTGGNIQIYVDGVPDGAAQAWSGSNTFTNVNTQSWIAGDPADSGAYSNGLIHEVILWNYGLSGNFPWEFARMAKRNYMAPDSPLRWVSTRTYSVPAAAGAQLDEDYQLFARCRRW